MSSLISKVNEEDLEEGSIASRMVELLKSEIGHDMIIHCPDKDFKVHRGIVQSVGGYFTGVCNQAFQEGNTKVITLEDSECTAGPMRAVLQFIYFDNYKKEECRLEDHEVILHAKVERLAQRFLMPKLQQIALVRFKASLLPIFGGLASDQAGGEVLKDAVTYVYNDHLASSEILRGSLVERLATYCTECEGAAGQFQDLLDISQPLAADLLSHKLVGRHKEPKTKTMRKWRCGDCEEDFIVDLHPNPLLRGHKPKCPFCREWGRVSKCGNSEVLLADD